MMHLSDIWSVLKPNGFWTLSESQQSSKTVLWPCLGLRTLQTLVCMPYVSLIIRPHLCYACDAPTNDESLHIINQSINQKCLFWSGLPGTSTEQALMTLTTPDSRSMICLLATELCNNGCTDRDAVCQADSCGPSEPCFRFGPYLSREIVQIFMFPAHGKVLGGCTLYGCMQQRYHQCCCQLQWSCLAGVTLNPPPMKNPPPAMRPVPKLLWVPVVRVRCCSLMSLNITQVKVKGKVFPYSLRALGPELIPVYRESARRWREVNHAIYPAVVCHCFLPGLRLPS